MKQTLCLFISTLFLTLPMLLKGEVVVFTKLDSADWTLPQNQDRIADSVWITRKHNQSIFNIALETGMTNISPLNTLWSRNSIINTEMIETVIIIELVGLTIGWYLSNQ